MKFVSSFALRNALFSTLYAIVFAGCAASTTTSGDAAAGTDASDSAAADIALAAGQAKVIGSPCTKDAECGTAPFMCITEHPGGYCSRGCDIGHADADCPPEAICQFDGKVGECRAKCAAQADCRSGCVCSPASNDAQAKASHAFCDIRDMGGDADAMSMGDGASSGMDM